MITQPKPPDVEDMKLMPVVLFDGACPLCSREIAHYRRLRGADQVEWVDVSTTPNLFWLYGIDRHTAMRRFHVRTPDGEWVVGAAAFVELWSHLRGYWLLARAVQALRMLPLLDRAYVRFADWRLKRRECDGDRCGIPPLDTPAGANQEV